MTEPSVSYPVREVLARIEREITEVRREVTQIQIALASSSAAEVVEKADGAKGQARAALWVAAASPLVSAFLAWLITRR